MKTQLKKGDKWATNKSKGYVADMVKEKITVKNWGYLEYKIIDIVKIIILLKNEIKYRIINFKNNKFQK